MAGSAENRQSSKHVSNVTAYCALFAFAIMQLGVALHHGEHSSTELASDCVACIQHEQFDDVVTVTPTLFAVEPEGEIVRTSGSVAASKYLEYCHGKIRDCQ